MESLCQFACQYHGACKIGTVSRPMIETLTQLPCIYIPLNNTAITVLSCKWKHPHDCPKIPELKEGHFFHTFCRNINFSFCPQKPKFKNPWQILKSSVTLPSLSKPNVANIRPPPPFPKWPFSLPGFHPLHFFPLYVYLLCLIPCL